MLVLKENTLPSFEWGIVVAIYLDDGYLNHKSLEFKICHSAITLAEKKSQRRSNEFMGNDGSENASSNANEMNNLL